MSEVYLMTCFDCRVALSLGKLFSHDETGRYLGAYTLQGLAVVAADGQRTFVRDESYLQAVEGFLIHHRNHEIRLVPEGVHELLEPPAVSLDPEEVSLPNDEINVSPEQELMAWRRILGA